MVGAGTEIVSQLVVCKSFGNYISFDILKISIKFKLMQDLLTTSNVMRHL